MVTDTRIFVYVVTDTRIFVYVVTDTRIFVYVMPLVLAGTTIQGCIDSARVLWASFCFRFVLVVTDAHILMYVMPSVLAGIWYISKNVGEGGRVFCHVFYWLSPQVFRN